MAEGAVDQTWGDAQAAVQKVEAARPIRGRPGAAQGGVAGRISERPGNGAPGHRNRTTHPARWHCGSDDTAPGSEMAVT
jgi:hypothetical protein